MGDDWPFDQPRNCAAISTRRVVEGREDILHVFHDANDHGWQFIGTNWRVEDGVVVSMQTVVKIDPTVLQIADLSPGWSATRSAVGGAWERRLMSPDEGEET